MRWLDLTLLTPAANLALDEALLLEAESGRSGELLRLWEWPQPAVVLGSGGNLGDYVEEELCTRDGVPILRRSSGGGTILLGEGCLCYSLILPFARAPALEGIRTSYVWILSRIIEAVSGLLPDITSAGISDLTSEGRKFSGNAQQRKREHLLHHGTLLYGFELTLLERYLKAPPRQPEYRASREHAEFVRNLRCSRAELCRRLRAVWEADVEQAIWPKDEVMRLVEAKYATEAWNRRR